MANYQQLTEDPVVHYNFIYLHRVEADLIQAHEGKEIKAVEELIFVLVKEQTTQAAIQEAIGSVFTPLVFFISGAALPVVAMRAFFLYAMVNSFNVGEDSMAVAIVNGILVDVIFAH